MANCYFIPRTVSSSDSTRSTIRRAYDGEFCYPIENAIQPVDDWELGRDIRFALQGIPSNFDRLSDECLLFVILLFAKTRHMRIKRTSGKMYFVWNACL